MSGLLLWATRFIVSALVLYTVAVWSEWFAGRLKGWHLALFWTGLAADTVGTSLMKKIAGGVILNFHGATGLAALLLMTLHTVWATVVLIRRDERALEGFHKFSLLVWLLWLVPFVTGVVIGMQR